MSIQDKISAVDRKLAGHHKYSERMFRLLMRKAKLHNQYMQEALDKSLKGPERYNFRYVSNIV